MDGSEFERAAPVRRHRSWCSRRILWLGPHDGQRRGFSVASGRRFSQQLNSVIAASNQQATAFPTNDMQAVARRELRAGQALDPDTVPFVQPACNLTPPRSLAPRLPGRKDRCDHEQHTRQSEPDPPSISFGQHDGTRRPTLKPYAGRADGLGGAASAARAVAIDGLARHPIVTRPARHSAVTPARVRRVSNSNIVSSVMRTAK